MSQIFVSYASEDRGRVQKIVDRLLQFTDAVFWDRTLRVGAKWRETIERELGSCKLVIVVWSRHAIVSDWVKYECAFCSARCPVLPVLIDDVDVPQPFDELQGHRLLGWPENDDATASAAFFDEVQQIVGGEDFPTSPERRRFDLEVMKSSLAGIGCAEGGPVLDPSLERLEREIGEKADEVIQHIEKAQQSIYDWKAIEERLSAAVDGLHSVNIIIARSLYNSLFLGSLEKIEKAKTQIKAFRSRHEPRKKKDLLTRLW